MTTSNLTGSDAIPCADLEPVLPPRLVGLAAVITALLSPDGLPPGVYVLAEPAPGTPWAGMICKSWHHGADAPPARCPYCGPGQA